jgi:hypothetical protein
MLTCNRRLRVVAAFLVRDTANFSPRQIAGAVFFKGGSITAAGPLSARASIDLCPSSPKGEVAGYSMIHPRVRDRGRDVQAKSLGSREQP